ncbi:MAG: hypothetical protein KAS63_03090 [Candidatus Heimdallarchaeota archaeon]|nr:hypothetical protein [Candidatus Heimdallarchaeota archaeon]MCK4954322.1 hypothetical protein [Candidatus Heimdallarchaeota archaeon]
MTIKDYLNFKPKALEVIRDKRIFNMVHNPKYSPILKCLHEGPLTLKEIGIKYITYLEKTSGTKKQPNIIYGYAKDLEKEGILVPCGKRITNGDPSAEILYSRSANLYYPVIASDDYWESEDNAIIIQKLCEIYNVYSKGSNLSPEEINKLMKSIYNEPLSHIGDFIEKNNDELASILDDLPFSLLDRIFNFLDILVIIQNPDFYKKQLKKYKRK